MSDFGGVEEFDQPEADSEVLSALVPLIIDESHTADERIEEDIDNLIDSVGMPELAKLKEYMNRGDLAAALCRHPLFVEAVERRIAQYADLLNSINFDDDGNL